MGTIPSFFFCFKKCHLWQCGVWRTMVFTLHRATPPPRWVMGQGTWNDMKVMKPLWYLVWEQDYVCACVQNYKMAFFATDSNHRVLWMAFIDQGEFEATKMLSSRRVLHCDNHQFCAKMTVSTWTVFKISLLNLVVWTKKKNNKNSTFATSHFCV